MSHLVERAQAQQITKEIEAEILGVLQKHGLAAPKLKTTYGDRYVLKIETTPEEKNEAGVNVNSPEAQAYLLTAEYNESLDPDALGREFTVRGETYVFLGMNTRAQKYPFLARRVKDGKTYKLAGDMVREHLAPQGTS